MSRKHVSATLELNEALDGDRGATGFSWSRAVRVRRDQVFGAGLRTWLIALAVIVVIRSLISLARSDSASLVPTRWETIFAVGTVSAALAFSLRPSPRDGSASRAAIQGGGLTIAGAAFVSMAAMHPGFGTEVMHAIVIIMLVGFAMLLPLPIPVGVPILAVVAAVYPLLLLASGAARAMDPIFAAQVVDLAAGLGMATLVLVLHNVLFAGRWRALRDLARLAEHDGLTGVFNRRAFLNRLLTEADRARRYGAPLGLVMFDIDSFKRFNTEEGYAAGDAMLRAVSATLVRVTRRPRFLPFGATVARYGGEEFVVTVPGADPDTVASLARECRAAVASLRVPFGARTPMNVTVSAGYAHTPGGTSATPTALIEAADRALYRAKLEGGDCAVAAGAEDTIGPASSPRLVIRKAPRASVPSSAVDALMSDSRHLHALVLRWMFAVTAVWAGLLGLMDVGLYLGGAPRVELAPILAGRLGMVVALAVLAWQAPRVHWWQQHLTALHAAFVLGIAGAIIFTMERSGGITSPYFGQLVYVLAAWALAFSVRPAVSVAVLFTVTVALPLYYVGYVGMDPFEHTLLARTAVLAGCGAAALGTQSVFRSLRAEEVSARHALDRLARVDPLTGLANRVGFEDFVERLLRRVGPTAPLSIAIVDLDHFKHVNDTHGHVAGDEVLVRVAHAIEEAVRAADVTARLGGEEFALLLPMTGPEGALLTAERVRAAIENLDLLDGALHTTVSIGLASWGPGDTLASLTARADRGLRAAKAAGRNRVVAG